MNTPDTNIQASIPRIGRVVRIAGGKETHFSFSDPHPAAFCKGLRSHRARDVSDKLGDITCKKCRHKAYSLNSKNADALGLLPLIHPSRK